MTVVLHAYSAEQAWYFLTGCILVELYFFTGVVSQTRVKPHPDKVFFFSGYFRPRLGSPVWETSPM